MTRRADRWQRWVKVRSTNGLARYSFGNQLLISLQRPDATYVAGFRAFLALNRCVRKGEKAIVLCMPVTVRVKSESLIEEARTGDGAERVLPRTVTRFVYRPR